MSEMHWNVVNCQKLDSPKAEIRKFKFFSKTLSPRDSPRQNSLKNPDFSPKSWGEMTLRKILCKHPDFHFTALEKELYKIIFKYLLRVTDIFWISCFRTQHIEGEAEFIWYNWGKIQKTATGKVLFSEHTTSFIHKKLAKDTYILIYCPWVDTFSSANVSFAKSLISNICWFIFCKFIDDMIWKVIIV